MRFLAPVLLLLASWAAEAQTTGCIYYGGYPWRTGGCLTAEDLNAAFNTGYQPPHTLAPGTAAANLGAARGDVIGTWSALQVQALNGYPVSLSKPATGQILQWNGNQYTPITLSMASLGNVTGPGVVGRASSASGPLTTLFTPPGAHDEIYQVDGTSTGLTTVGTWIGANPQGGAISIGDCNLNCLGAMISDSVATGRNLYLHGGGIVGSSYPATVTEGLLIQTQTIAVPPVQGKFIMMDYNTVQGVEVGNADPFMQFDSAILLRFYNYGQIGYANNGDALVIKPSGALLPVDGIVGFSDSTIDIQAIATVKITSTPPTAGALVTYDMTNGGSAAIMEHYGELIGGAAPGDPPFTADSFRVINTAAHSFIGHRTEIVHAHVVYHACVEAGNAPTVNIAGNMFIVNDCVPAGQSAGSSYGHIEWGRGDIALYGMIANTEGTADVDKALGTGISYESSANGTVAIVGYLTNYNTAGINNKTGSQNNFTVVGYQTPYGAAPFVKDGGANNAVWQGSVMYSASGLTAVGVDSVGNPSTNYIQGGGGADTVFRSRGATNARLDAPAGQQVQFSNNDTVIAYVDAAGLTVAEGATVFVGESVDLSSYSLISLNGNTSPSGGATGLMGGPTGDFYLMAGGAGNLLDFNGTALYPNSTAAVALGLASPLREFSTVLAQAGKFSASLAVGGSLSGGAVATVRVGTNERMNAIDNSGTYLVQWANDAGNALVPVQFGAASYTFQTGGVAMLSLGLPTTNFANNATCDTAHQILGASSTFLYVCTAVNTVGRVPITAF